jgi:hypothetical protein
MAVPTLERNLLLLREQGLQAIRMNSAVHLRRIAQKHVVLVGDYIAARSRFRAKLQSRRPTALRLLGFESPVVFQIMDSLAELIRQAFSSQQEDLIMAAVYVLVEGESLTLNHEAVSLYEAFSKLVEECLVRVLLFDDSARRHVLMERVIRSQEDFAKYNIQWSHLEKSDSISDTLPRFGLALLKIFTIPIKTALERKDIESFRQLVTSLYMMLQAGIREPGSDFMVLETQLRHNLIASRDRPKALVRLNRLKQEIDFYDSISNYKTRMVFGLGGWATNLYSSEKLSSEQFSTAFDQLCSVLGSFEQISKLYLELQVSDNFGPRGEAFGWEFWGADEKILGGAYAGFSSSRPSWLSQFYILAAVRTIQGLPDTEGLIGFVKEKDISSLDLNLIAEDIRSISDNFLENAQKWSVVLPRTQGIEVPGGEQSIQGRQEFDRLNELWKSLVMTRRAEEEEAVVAGHIDDAVIERFRAEYRKAWTENSSLRTLAHTYNFFEDLTTQLEVPSEVQKFGRNFLEKKEWFLSKADFAVRSLAEASGKGMGEAESTWVFGIIRGALQPVSAQDPGALMQELNAFIDAIDLKHRSRYAILSSIGYEIDAEFYRSDGFDRTSVSDKNREVFGIGYRGVYKGVPLVELWIPATEKIRSVICAELRTLGRWVQYHSGQVGEDLKLSISSIDQVGAKELLTRNPGLKLAQNQSVNDAATAIRELLKTVHIQIWQRFTYKVLDTQAALRIDLPEQRM